MTTVAEVRVADAGGCQTYQCGANSPILAGQPLVNLRLDGVAQGDVQLVPESLANLTACPRASGGRMMAVDRLRLSIDPADSSQLVALDAGAAGRVRCSGRQLVGATFAVTVTSAVPPRKGKYRPTKPPTPVTMTLRIADVDRMRTWVRARQQRKLLWIYRFEVVEAGKTIEVVKGKPVEVALPPNRPLCSVRVGHEDFQDFDGADATANGQDIDAGTMQHPRPWTTPTDFAIIARGEAFDEETGDSVRMTDPAFDYGTFFNIGCMGTGVAKMRLLGVDPMDATLPAGATSATLKMLGARYDGHTAETTPGMPLMWTRMWGDDVGYFGGPNAEAEPGPIEAAWGANGALCLAHFRPGMPTLGARFRNRGGYARIIGANEANRVNARRRATGLPDCDPANLPAGTLWVSTTIDHPEHGLTLPETFFVAGGAQRSYLSGSAPPAMAAKLKAKLQVAPVKAPIAPVNPIKPPVAPIKAPTPVR